MLANGLWSVGLAAGTPIYYVQAGTKFQIPTADAVVGTFGADAWTHIGIATQAALDALPTGNWTLLDIEGDGGGVLGSGGTVLGMPWPIALIAAYLVWKALEK